jgi:ADP-ribosylglycohydrolase
MENPRPYHSFGNGSAMRVSSAGWLYDNVDDVLHAAALSASVTHDHPEGIKGAQAIASCILLARFKFSKEDILKYMYLKFGYDMDFTLDEIRDHNRFDETCQVTVPQAVRAFYEGKSFEDVIRLSISLGGDSDTIACMAGGIAEAYYGMREKQRRQVSDHMDPYCRSMIRKYHTFYLSHAGR